MVPRRQMNVLVRHGVMGRMLYYNSRVLTAECALRMPTNASLFGATGPILRLSARNRVPLLKLIYISLLSDVAFA
jgi:hypothetical protein